VGTYLAGSPRPDRRDVIARVGGARQLPEVLGADHGGRVVRVSVAEVVRVAVPFTWLGMVLAISFLETPLKFRAPGITVPLGLGIGRLVFRALAVAELALAVALTAALVLELGTVGVGAAPWMLTALLWAVLAVQAAVLRPRLDQRARMVVAGQCPPRSRLHLAYVALDGIKVVVLSIVGIVLVAGIAS
jgi:hypothetical protein